MATVGVREWEEFKSRLFAEFVWTWRFGHARATMKGVLIEARAVEPGGEPLHDFLTKLKQRLEAGGPRSLSFQREQEVRWHIQKVNDAYVIRPRVQRQVKQEQEALQVAMLAHRQPQYYSTLHLTPEQAQREFDSIGAEMDTSTTRERLVELGRRRAELAPLTGRHYTYENHCWACGGGISSSIHARCSTCEWYICGCGACEYNHYGH
ncbi:MAG TPA: hypothetical protein VF120_09100 [Ktedonobacterales bacterium]